MLGEVSWLLASGGPETSIRIGPCVCLKVQKLILNAAHPGPWEKTDQARLQCVCGVNRIWTVLCLLPSRGNGVKNYHSMPLSFRTAIYSHGADSTPVVYYSSTTRVNCSCPLRVHSDIADINFWCFLYMLLLFFTNRLVCITIFLEICMQGRLSVCLSMSTKRLHPLCISI